MADTTTPVYSFVLPEIDGSDGTWGTKLNANLTALDGLLSGSANLQNASFTGTASFGGSTGTAGQVLKSQGAGANAIWTDDSNTTYTAGSGLSLTGTEFANTAPDQTVVMNAGSGISVSGTYPTFTVTNSSPDQTVGLTGTGGTTISGTYPNFTINSTDNNTTYTAGTGLTLTSTEFSVTDNGIGALQLNVSGNGTSGQVLQSDGDGSFSWTSAGTGGNETLAQTLALGAVTGGTDISVSSGDNIVMAANSTVDGRDVSVDGAKLDLINQGVATTDSPTFAGLTVDTTTLAVDSTNNRVGIGTTSPSEELHLSQSASGADVCARIQNSAVSSGDTATLRFSVTSNSSYDSAFVGSDRNNALILGSNAAERMRIDSSGNVGIGTSSPSAVLETFGGTSFIGAKFKGYTTGKTALVGTDNNSAWFGLDDGTYGLTNSIQLFGTNNSIEFNTAGAERMRITSTGRLVIASAGGSDTGYIRVPVAGSTLGAWTSYAGTASTRKHMRFQTSSGDAGYISTTGLTTFYGTSSDYRLKTDAQPMTGATARLKALKPVNFEWIADGTRVDGFLAHEAQEVVPECVTGEKDAMQDQEYEVTPAVLDEEGNTVEEAVMGTRSVPDYQGIDQSKLVPLLVATIQELEARITQLENS